MNNKMGSYDHLNTNTSDLLFVTIDMDNLAAEVCNLNYGVHRLLSAIVRERSKRNIQGNYSDELVDGIKKLLDKGYY